MTPACCTIFSADHTRSVKDTPLATKLTHQGCSMTDLIRVRYAMNGRRGPLTLDQPAWCVSLTGGLCDVHRRMPCPVHALVCPTLRHQAAFTKALMPPTHITAARNTRTAAKRHKDHRCVICFAHRMFEHTSSTRGMTRRSADIRARVWKIRSNGVALACVISRYHYTIGPNPSHCAAEEPTKAVIRDAPIRFNSCDRISSSSLEHHDRQVIDRAFLFRG